MKPCLKTFSALLVSIILTGCGLSAADKLANAALEGDETRVQQLLAKKINVNSPTQQGYNALMVASAAGQTKIVKMLLEAGADANFRAADSAEEHAGEHALLLACKQNHANVVKALLAAGADVNLPSLSGETPLIISCQRGHSEIVKLLLQAHAQVNTPNRQGQTPLMLAGHNGHTDIVQLLLKHRADVSLQDKSGQTALDYARKPRIVSLLEEVQK